MDIVCNDSRIETEFFLTRTAKGDYVCNEKAKVAVISVRSRLKKFIDQWKIIGASKFILDVLERGYKIPFVDLPTPFTAKHNLSACKHSKFVNEAVNDLLAQNCIEEILERPGIVNPLSVSIQSSGKKRLIIDLRHVNKFVYKQKFKCEDIKTIIQLLNKDYFMFNFDLKSAYHHVEIFSEHRKYLTFAWDLDNSTIRYFQFCVLPFGLSSAPFVFTKLLKPLSQSWRRQGIPIAIYLDDGLGGGRNHCQAKIFSLVVHADLLKCGFMVNELKSHWEPVQEITWLGYVIDTSVKSIRATDKRISKLVASINDIVDDRSDKLIHVKELASVVGQIISLETSVGNIVRLMTRSAYRIINSCSSWYAYIKIDSPTLRELGFWRDTASHLNCKQLWSENLIPSKVVYSDASNDACGAVLDVDGVKKISQCNWSEEEKTKSSTWRELKAVRLALEAFRSDLSNRTIAWFTDNQSIVSIVSNGSKVQNLQDLALELFTICAQCNISLDVKWIPRDLNTEADSVSRIVDYDDYTINDHVFNILDSQWGPHTVDRFACVYNAKLTRFNSRFYQPESEAVDAFTQNWRYENNWLFPPTILIPKVINHLKASNAKGTLVIPLWKSSAFWTLLCDDGVHWNPWIHGWELLSNINHSLIIRGKTKNSFCRRSNYGFQFVALRISFLLEPRILMYGFCTSPDGICEQCVT